MTTQEDSDTKTIILDRRYLMGFAGLARVRGDGVDPAFGGPRRRRLEAWLGEELAGKDPDGYFETIAESFGPLCEAQGYHGRHEFRAVGWRSDGALGPRVPEIVTIDNRAKVHSFHVYREELGDRAFLIDFSGWAIPMEIREAFIGLVDRNVAGFAYQPRVFANAVRGLYRRVSPMSGGFVGDSCLITTLPRSAVPLTEPPGVYLAEPMDEVWERRPIFWFYPSRSSPEEDGAFGPAFICREFSSGGARIGRGVEGYFGPLEGM